MTDTIGVVLMTTTGGRRNHTGSPTGNPGMAVVRQSVCFCFCFFLLLGFLICTSSLSSILRHSIHLAVDDRTRPEERRRNELYRQYYEEIQRRYETDRPVDCSVIVVNKAQKYVHSLLLQLRWPCLHEDKETV